MRFFHVSDWKKIPFDVEMHLLGKESVQFRLYFFADRRPPLNFSLSNYRLLPDPTAPIPTTIHVGLLPSITATTAKKKEKGKSREFMASGLAFSFLAPMLLVGLGFRNEDRPAVSG